MNYKQSPQVTITPPSSGYSQPNSSGNMIGSIIQGGASIVGGAIDAISNAINQKKALKAQQAENQKNREHAEMMYRKYESPQAQAQQMAAAGLNPAAQGAVSTQSVGSASTGSLPTPSPSSFGSSIAEGAIQAVNSYSQRKQFQQQLDQDALNQTRNFFLELDKLNLSKDELQIQIDLWREQIEASKVSREYQQKINKQLQEFIDAGGNQFKDDSNVKKAQTLFSQVQAFNAYQESIIKNNVDKRAAERHLEEMNIMKLQRISLENAVNDENIKRNLYSLGYNFDSLPPYLQGPAMYLSMLHTLYHAGKISQDTFDKHKNEFSQEMNSWKNHVKNSENPDYITELDKEDLAERSVRLWTDLIDSIIPG